MVCQFLLYRKVTQSFIFIYIYVCMYTCIYMCMYMYVCIHLYIIHMYMYVYMCMYMYTYVCVYVCVCVCIYIYICIYIPFLILSSIMVYPKRLDIVLCAVTVGPHCLSMLSIVVCIYYPQTPHTSHSLSPRPWQPQVCSLCLWVCFCLVDRFISATYKWYHMAFVFLFLTSLSVKISTLPPPPSFLSLHL